VLNGKSTDLFQSPEDKVDAYIQSLGSAGPLSSAFDQLVSARTASIDYGFSEMRVGVHGGALAFTFVDGPLAKPQLMDLAAQRNATSFLSDVLQVEQTQVHAGDQDNVSGSSQSQPSPHYRLDGRVRPAKFPGALTATHRCLYLVPSLTRPTSRRAQPTISGPRRTGIVTNPTSTILQQTATARG
jgi:hypothetical protein